MTVRDAALPIALLAISATAAVGLGASDPQITQPPTSYTVARAKLVKLDGQRDYWKARAKALEKTVRTGPDFEVSIRLAAIAYGQDWRHLKACALSEGGQEGERFLRFNARPNRAGSGATGLFQFMRGTFLGTPFASFDWHRQDVQAHAAAWMFAQGRSNEWTGKDC